MNLFHGPLLSFVKVKRAMLIELLAKIKVMQEEGSIMQVVCFSLLAKHLWDRLTKVFSNTPFCTHCVDLTCMLMTADNGSYPTS